MKSMNLYSRRLDYLSRGRKKPIDPELRAFIDGLSPRQVSWLSDFSRSGRVFDLAAYHEVETLGDEQHGP
jgi:hypothetical protein